MFDQRISHKWDPSLCELENVVWLLVLSSVESIPPIEMVIFTFNRIQHLCALYAYSFQITSPPPSRSLTMVVGTKLTRASYSSLVTIRHSTKELYRLCCPSSLTPYCPIKLSPIVQGLPTIASRRSLATTIAHCKEYCHWVWLMFIPNSWCSYNLWTIWTTFLMNNHLNLGIVGQSYQWMRNLMCI